MPQPHAAVSAILAQIGPAPISSLQHRSWPGVISNDKYLIKIFESNLGNSTNPSVYD